MSERVSHEKREGNCRIVYFPGTDSERPELWNHEDCPVCRAERAEARVKELEEELTAIKHEAWRLVQVLNAYDGSGIPRSDASDAFAFLQKIGVERVLRGEGGE